MIIGTVIGEITSTIHHPFYDGKKMLMVEKSNVEGKASEDYLIAIDSVGAGVGQEVLILDEGTGARQIVNSVAAPVRSVTTTGAASDSRLGPQHSPPTIRKPPPARRVRWCRRNRRN